MQLSRIEFKAMNNPVRRFVQKHFEFPIFKSFGLKEKNKEILEIGCGSGYGAALLKELEPLCYDGIDIMPEQVDLARKRNLENCSFQVMDATNMAYFQDESRDIIVIFGILHHIIDWKKAVSECRRILRFGGKLFVEEPDRNVVKKFDSIFNFGHSPQAGFTLKEFEDVLKSTGFEIVRRRKILSFGIYSCARVS